METLQDLIGGVAPFPEPGERVSDSEWSDSAEYGTVTWAYYPSFRVAWDSDELVSNETVTY